MQTWRLRRDCEGLETLKKPVIRRSGTVTLQSCNRQASRLPGEFLCDGP
jgi:hypothetical protein